MEGVMRWGIAGAGMGALTVVALIGWQLAASGNGVWIVALLPIGGVVAGAIVLAARED